MIHRHARIDLGYNAASQFDTIIRYSDLDGGSGNIAATAMQTPHARPLSPKG